MSNLPEELVREILLRVPVKSLMRFKCVRKSWNGLFRSPFFVAQHLALYKSNSNSKSDTIIFIEEYFDHVDDRPIYPIPRVRLLCNDSKVAVPAVIDLYFPSPPPSPFKLQFQFQSQSPSQSPTIIIPCAPQNGIFFLSVSYDYNYIVGPQSILWNPATRDVKVLPPPPYPVFVPTWFDFTRYGPPPDSPPKPTHYGFGFDPKTNDHKVVCLWTTTILPTQVVAIQIYNLSTDSWRTTKLTAPIIVKNLRPSRFDSYLNGFYHWFIGNSSYDRALLCFDMTNETLRTMNLPTRDPYYAYLKDIQIAVINDCLTCFRLFYNQLTDYIDLDLDSTQLEIWVMDEYGVEATWSKRFDFGPFPPCDHFYGLWKDGQFVEGFTGQPLLITRRAPLSQVQGFPPCVTSCWVYKYMETVVPLSV